MILIHHLFRLPARGSITILEGKLPCPNRPTPPDHPLYALEKTLQNRISQCRFIVVRAKQQSKITRGLLSRIRHERDDVEETP